MNIKNIKKTWKKYKDTWVGTLVYVLLGLLIAYGFNLFLGVVLQTGTPVVAVFSNSMVPTYYKGDMIFVANGDVSVGDIVIFNAPGKNYPIIHRVQNITDGILTTKGDANSVSDPWNTSIEDVHGKAVLRVPYLGWVKIWLIEIIS